jgi:hypothetical protein
VRITVRDVVPDYLAFQREARERGPAELRPLWERLYARRHPDVFESYVRVCGRSEVEPALERLVAADWPLAERAERVAEAACTHASRVGELLGAEHAELRCVTLVGLSRADAWVDELDGILTACFAVEQWQAPPWEVVQVVHETAHVVNAAAVPEPWSDEVLGIRLLLEGVAVTTTHTLVPELPEWMHFNFPPAEIAAWLGACEEAWPSTAATLRDLLRTTDPSEHARFFMPEWGRSARDVPAKVGYFAGAKVVERLARDRSLSELVRLRPGEALGLAVEALA